MCRHLAYIGTPITLHDLLMAPEFSLEYQASRPRFQKNGIMNVDGFGVGFYVDGRAEAVRYRRAQSMWSDQSFAALAPVLSSGCILAAVRAATPGFAVDEPSTAPFASGPWLFSHNGSVRGFRDGAGAELRPLLDAHHAPESAVDSALLWALFQQYLDQGIDAGTAMDRVIRDVRRVSSGELNLLATDGSSIWATAAGNSLYLVSRDGSVVVASEPYDESSDWREVPDDSLVTVERGTVSVTPLSQER